LRLLSLCAKNQIFARHGKYHDRRIVSAKNEFFMLNGPSLLTHLCLSQFQSLENTYASFRMMTDTSSRTELQSFLFLGAPLYKEGCPRRKSKVGFLNFHVHSTYVHILRRVYCQK
jgi:hypothetical protein